MCFNIIPAGHISFIVVKIDDQPEVHDMRIDVGLSDEDYDRCFKDDVCSFQVILATRDTQFGQELALVMQTTHAQR